MGILGIFIQIILSSKKKITFKGDNHPVAAFFISLTINHL
jgi:hypothetical protein